MNKTIYKIANYFEPLEFRLLRTDYNIIKNTKGNLEEKNVNLKKIKNKINGLTYEYQNNIILSAFLLSSVMLLRIVDESLGSQIEEFTHKIPERIMVGAAILKGIKNYYNSKELLKIQKEIEDRVPYKTDLDYFR